ncbi:MAG: hypothetical protein ABSC55_25840, partial [Syntrophorhabdales bacterium]
DESEHLENLASHRRCAERIQAAWEGFAAKRDQRLEQQRRLGEASEKVAENILEDLFTTVLDWPLADFNNQVEHADIVLTDHGIKRLVVEVKRPGSLAWSRRAVENALAQATRYAGEQKVKAVAVSDGVMLYAANIAEGGLQDRVFVSLSAGEPPLAESLMGFLRNGEIDHFDDARSLGTTPSLIETMSFKPAIPWEVELLQSLPPLHKLRSILTKKNQLKKQNPSNGNCRDRQLARPKGLPNVTSLCASFKPRHERSSDPQLMPE